MIKNIPQSRSNYKYFQKVGTRFGDNDVFGHVNNVVYYAMFDTVINRFLINECGYNPVISNIIGISPETRCKFFKPIRYPEVVDVGLKIKNLGNSSVIYDISIFCDGEEMAAAEGHFVHVFVSRSDQKKVLKIPAYIHKKFKEIL
tara:strand:- start:248 stop:682 length:435 start_codon:yes stop_codon:yes gene_type:complete